MRDETPKQRGFFGIGIYHGKRSCNIGTLWRTANIFGASYIYTIGRRYKRQSSDTMKTLRHVPLFEFEDFSEFLTARPRGARLIAIEIKNDAINLADFHHPEQAVYLLGAEDGGIPNHILTKCNSIVKLPGDTCLNVSTAGSIVVYDRITKRA